ncbi:chemotaxis-specific protein-glutamate methyltransferase CheB [Halomonas sp. McH1-25]|uniref:chemotaxis-specific protein-glutamate methyltransferase CheB n=1 Tax=unclassified Halomonas TaxID=2609666 RepID=UPI001EF5940E|nr:MULTISPECIES: chemotaxis-specific protein-glutamate methyltransferase CheB [unclassified Halomonas]MCG7601111.1 chemotaxis-specific protein-glutamate methyltransferase CheB [Halomonas sp. McH1-25]MCP1342981.1 chemotaxis-specific protein-glutamate methyltransferase CheB [Halomonas sp. FL8]MCP1360833.1 chemotaxis-specific protein-glutamate methyltransferase CheB [Halomonas sp. BBD45]MCP1364431.1 chemotaxis-specific protein-glutamate methyltransferase CheB [Halomonas sp. BBD48]
MIRLLIVDDSALMRRHLQQVFEAEGDFDLEVARNGVEAIELARAFDPDVITLDINMPEMDGLTALSMLMAEQPRSVVMFSSLTEQGAIASLEAMALGAVDFFPKPGGTISLNIDQVREALVAKVRAAATAHVKTKKSRLTNTKDSQPSQASRSDMLAPASLACIDEAGEGLVLIGSSTGGPRTLEDVLVPLPANYPYPIVVAQHMPANFTRAFAERVNNLAALEVVEASRPMPLEAGRVYIGMGGSDVCISRRAGKPYVLPKPESASYLWHPSVSLLVETALQHYPAKQLTGVMLTGMGHDGAEEMTELKRRGGRTLAESKESAVVFGMPAELIRRGGASDILPATDIAATLIQWCAHKSPYLKGQRHGSASQHVH